MRVAPPPPITIGGPPSCTGLGSAGESATVTVELGEDAFSYYDPEQGGWVLEPGSFTILAGRSSRDIRQSAEVVW